MPRNNHGGSINGSSLNSPSLPPIDNPSSPYYVHPKENPTDVLVSPPLSWNNYHSWARAMKRATVLKNKFGFLEGSILMPESSDPSFDAWERCNSLVHSWLMSSMIPSIAHCILYEESAAEVWKDLRETFSRGDLIRIYELQQELYSFKQNSLSVNEYFSRLRMYWGELQSYRPTPTPDCVRAVKCVCEATRNQEVYKQQDYAIRFLMGLNKQFSVVKSKILLMDPLPSLNCVFSMVLQYEKLNSLAPSEGVKALINHSDGKKQGSEGKMNAKQRTFCGRAGHRVVLVIIGSMDSLLHIRKESSFNFVPISILLKST